MPQTPHTERHFTGSETLRDIVIGMSDGLTVPFALAAGLSGAVNSTQIVVTAGLAEIAAAATNAAPTEALPVPPTAAEPCDRPGGDGGVTR